MSLTFFLRNRDILEFEHCNAVVNWHQTSVGHRIAATKVFLACLLVCPFCTVQWKLDLAKNGKPNTVPLDKKSFRFFSGLSGPIYKQVVISQNQFLKSVL